MKLSIAFIIVPIFFSLVKATTFTPARIAYTDLLNPPKEPSGSSVFRKTLQEVGMVSITDIPSFRPIKLETLMALPDCIQESTDVAKHIFPDGTLRQTIATHTVAGDMQTIQHSSSSSTAACQALDQISTAFRQTVADVTNAFAAHLAAVLDLHDDPLLVSQDRAFSLTDVVQQGEHLEHFHSYQASLAENQDDVETIEWHIDQGMALVFTPGLLAKDGQNSEGFYIQLIDGSTAMVDFEEQDDLVILLGDGVNQYINSALQTKDQLRALPHALRMPKTDQSRVWYGLMVLPPPTALHPLYKETFGDLRHSMMFDHQNSGSLALGCSSSMQARELKNVTCEEDAFFCWHQCFNHTTDASPEVCASQGLDLACINDERQLWIGDHNKAFYPGCVDLATAKNYTPPEVDVQDTGDTSASVVAGMAAIVGALAVSFSLS